LHVGGSGHAALNPPGENMDISKYGGHLGRHLEFQSYSSLMKRLSTHKLFQGVKESNHIQQQTMSVKPVLPPVWSRVLIVHNNISVMTNHLKLFSLLLPTPKSVVSVILSNVVFF